MVSDVYGASHKGNVRDLNEDSFCVHGFTRQEPYGFCIVSDGMGGHNAGEVASQQTVQFVAEELLRKLTAQEVPKALNQATRNANDRVCRMAMANQSQRGMGATLVAAYVCEEQAYIANVGDSRAYAYRNGELLQITRDHSVVEELVANGTITKEEARNHPQRNIITRAIGSEGVMEPDIFEYDYYPGDILLLCSDGLSSMLNDAEIQKILMENTNAKQMVTALIDAANRQGGRDNITVICIRFIQEGER
ncbi:MAG: Stp1/IreP family PP2C-type Ser/Thr phosphatase [Clostridia bacterium]|nr:Stp1/IreP family PP2C-type Ser/Thr phosphatase [Clostridia bacterium]